MASDAARLTLLCIGDADSVHVAGRVAAFARRGHAVTLLTERPATVAGVEVRPVTAEGRWGRLIQLLCGARLILTARSDLIHIHYAAGVLPWLAVAFARQPLVVSAMGGDVLDHEQHPLPSLGRWMTRRLLRSAALVTAKTREMTDEVVALGVDRARMMTVIWGVDGELFHPSPPPCRRLSTLAIGDDDRVILSPRLLRPFYNVHVLIDALPTILAAQPQALLVVTEHGADPDYARQLRQRVADLGVSGRVRWAGSVPQVEMPALYARADVVVSIPPSDGFPQSVLEALSCETPCVMTNLGRFRDIVEDGRHVVFAEPTAGAVAAAVLSLLADRLRAVRIGQAGRQRVVERASLADSVAAMEDRMRALVASPKRTRSTPRWWWRLGALAVLLGWSLRVAVASTPRRGI